jgi:hypothetical protein
MLENTLATTPHARLNCCHVALKLKDPKTEFYHYVSTTGHAGSLMHMQPKKNKCVHAATPFSSHQFSSL